MNLFESLTHEHQLIARTLDALEGFIQAIEAGAAVEQQELARFVLFYVDYVDFNHHQKEEQVLFRSLERAGWARDVGALAHLDEQHGQERNLMRTLRRLAVTATWGDKERRELIEHGRRVIEFERGHMHKERELLYPTAVDELANDQALVTERLSRFEKRGAPAEHLAWLEQLATELIGRWAKPTA